MGLFRRMFGLAADVAVQDFTAPDLGGIRTVDGVISAAMSSATWRSNAPVSREDALGVPAVQRGRNLICSVATLPLRQYGPDRKVARLTLLQQIDPRTPNVVVLAQTIEDLLFESVAYWRVTQRGWNRIPVAAERVDRHRITEDRPAGGQSLTTLPSGVDPDSVCWIDGKIVPKADLIRFDSPNSPLLTAARRAIRRAIALEDAAALYAANPRPADYFTTPDGDDPDPDKVGEFLTDWDDAREDNATAWVPGWLEYHGVDSPSPRDLQLVELQQRVTLDIANAIGLDPEELGVSTTSRTYANVTDRRRDKINDVLAVYMRAISDRLSMNDVTRQGYVVRFDLADYLKADPITRVTYYEKMVALKALTINEIRESEDLSDLPGGSTISKPEPPVAPAVPVQEAPMPQQNQRTISAQFDSAEPMHLQFELADFKADAAKRTVSGTLLPFNAVGRNGQGRWRFAEGSIEWNRSAVSRVKLNRDHDRKALIGAATVLGAAGGGIAAAFKVARGALGDQALSEAEDGILDGFSAEVDILDYEADPENEGVNLVTRAVLKGAALTGAPAFDDARLTSVAASKHTEGNTPVTDTATEQTAQTAPAAPAAGAQFSQADLDRLISERVQAELASGGPQAEMTASTKVSEGGPYRFDRGGNLTAGTSDFSRDLIAMGRRRENGEDRATPEARRVLDFIAAQFATVTTDVNETNPTIQRPDMYVDQRDYTYPVWSLISRGAPPNGVQPFTFPKYNSSTGLVGDHTEGVEPTPGAFTTTSQTVQPSALSGKASITREVWDMGGNPAVSNLIFEQMRKSWFEGLENAAADFLATLTAATDITLTTAAADDDLAGEWDAALAGLQFIRRYDFSAFVMESTLYKKFVAAVDSTGRKLFPILAPSNANGTSTSRFRQLDLSGVIGIPSWAVDANSTPGSSNSNWLFDPSVVFGWATAPTRLEFPGTDAAGGYAPVAMVDLAIWGYKAFANTDIGGVREVKYDSVA